jgi:DNA modification methylase
MNEKYQLICGDALTVLKTLDSESIQCVVTSPPYYGLRDYGIDGQIGMEKNLQEYILKLIDIFREVKRVLKNDGTFWLNMGDSYSCSGKGGNPEESPHHKQKTNRGSEQYVKSKRIARGVGRWGGGNNSVVELKPKDLIGLPWRIAFALQTDGWYLRSDIIWAKPNPMPESVSDRPTRSHEYIFLLSKSARYYYDSEAIKENSVCPDERMVDGFVPKSANGKHAGDPQSASIRKSSNSCARKVNESPKPGEQSQHIEDREDIEYCGTRNKRDVWTVATSPYPEAHFATYPPKLIEPCILAGSRPGDIILDPFNGSGTTGEVALRNQRKYIGIELKPEYIKLSEKRLSVIAVKLF